MDTNVIFPFTDPVGEFALQITPKDTGVSIRTFKGAQEWGPRALFYPRENLLKILDRESALYKRCKVALRLEGGRVNVDDCIYANLLKLLKTLEVNIVGIEGGTPELLQTNPYRFFIYDDRNHLQFVPLLLVKELIQQHRFYSTGPKGLLYYYQATTGVWIREGEAIARHLISAMLDALVKRHYVLEGVSLLRDMLYVKPTFPTPDPTKFVVQNGVLDLTTGILEPFDPDLYAVNRIPVTYEPSATYPQITAFLEAIVEPDDQATLQEWSKRSLNVNGFLVRSD